MNNHSINLFKYYRRETINVSVGNSGIGGNNPIRIQSMTTSDTMDTTSTVNESIRMINSGCEFVRITTPSIHEAKNLINIKKELKNKGYSIPIIADIHFTPNAAEIAARIVEKVRINPGNYADKKKFNKIEYDDNSYNQEIERIYERVSPLIKICKEYGTAIRIGTNHGSLSDRIMSRFGDTPLGMVESALEYLRICEDLNYYNIVLSMKASNPLVMVHAYRLLVDKLENSKLKNYPIHLGVTEAGEGEDGRIKSSIGIGTLLDDGIGDTVRVSLTEPPEFESPIAKILIDRYLNRSNHEDINIIEDPTYYPFEYSKRETHEISNIGGTYLPIVISDFSLAKEINEESLNNIGYRIDKKNRKIILEDTAPDYIYVGKNYVSNKFYDDIKIIVDYEGWIQNSDQKNIFPLILFSDFINNNLSLNEELNFIYLKTNDVYKLLTCKIPKNIVFILESNNDHFMADMRSFFFSMKKIKNPVVISGNYNNNNFEKNIIYSSTDLGGLFIQGYGDGIFIRSNKYNFDINKRLNTLSFKILQAARVRVTTTDFISCPSCGRTLFDLTATTAKIREKTDHLKGLKIGIMGCIVNGPGEMADADYGYVGSGKEKITLYKGKEVVKRSVHYRDGVDELIKLIKNDGNWIDP